MENKNTIFIVILISLCILSIFFALFLFRYVKTIESEYTAKEASLIKENMDLRDRIDSMKITIGEKTKEIRAIKAEKEKLAKEMKLLEEESKKREDFYSGKIKALEKEKEKLAEEIKSLKETSLVELIQKAKELEQNENIRKLLERTLQNIELIRSGNVVDLEPIVISQKKEAQIQDEGLNEQPAGLFSKGVVGEVLSLDKENNLIVINLGIRDNVREGQRLVILDGTEEIASGEIISSRYRISAAFIDNIRYRHTIGDIESGNKVLMRE